MKKQKTTCEPTNYGDSNSEPDYTDGFYSSSSETS